MPSADLYTGEEVSQRVNSFCNTVRQDAAPGPISEEHLSADAFPGAI